VISQYFNTSPVLYLEGRLHPIQIYFTKHPQSDYLQATLVSVFQIHQVHKCALAGLAAGVL
jgi:ATP-dependent RNA helicase DHX33